MRKKGGGRMIEDGLKVMTTRFEGRGHINISIERCIDVNDTSVPVACRIHIDSPVDNGMNVPDDSIWLDDISDLEVLHDAIGAYLDMIKGEQKREEGKHDVQSV
jgi:hypothetical protein